MIFPRTSSRVGIVLIALCVIALIVKLSFKETSTDEELPAQLESSRTSESATECRRPAFRPIGHSRKASVGSVANSSKDAEMQAEERSNLSVLPTREQMLAQRNVYLKRHRGGFLTRPAQEIDINLPSPQLTVVVSGYVDAALGDAAFLREPLDVTIHNLDGGIHEVLSAVESNIKIEWYSGPEEQLKELKVRGGQMTIDISLIGLSEVRERDRAVISVAYAEFLVEAELVFVDRGQELNLCVSKIQELKGDRELLVTMDLSTSDVFVGIENSWTSAFQAGRQLRVRNPQVTPYGVFRDLQQLPGALSVRSLYAGVYEIVFELKLDTYEGRANITFEFRDLDGKRHTAFCSFDCSSVKKTRDALSNDILEQRGRAPDK